MSKLLESGFSSFNSCFILSSSTFLDAPAPGEGEHLLFDLLAELRFAHLDGVEPFASVVGQMLAQQRLFCASACCWAAS